MTLREAFAIKPGEVISLVGGGGKTTLMFALAHELASSGGCLITTTTTKFLEPSASETPLLILNRNEEEIIQSLLQNVKRYQHITVASERLHSGKLKGITPEFVVTLAGLGELSYIIVEADGSAQKPLKAPNATEPVIPPNTNLVIPVVGIEALDGRLTEENVFRSEIASKLLGLSSGSIITTEAIAQLIIHRQGMTKGSPRQSRIIPFINKVDVAGSLLKARDLAYKILAMSHSKVEQVVLGQARFPEPVIEVISRQAL